MASQTPNYGLNKIDLTDAPPDITVLNDNADIIDTQLKTLSDSIGGGDAVNEINEKIGTNAQTGDTTVFAKLNGILSRLGLTNDSGGTTTAGSISAKLNAILSSIQSNFSSLLSGIGNTNDANGTTTSGSIFAKLNKLLTDWTTSRASKIDTIDTNASATATQTAINNTASETGTLSQKLSKVINDVSTINTVVTSKGVVKSVQRGVMDGTTSFDDRYTIALATVDPTKCSVTFENNIDSGGNPSFGPRFISLTANSLVVSRPICANAVQIGAMWQVVEYY